MERNQDVMFTDRNWNEGWEWVPSEVYNTDTHVRMATYRDRALASVVQHNMPCPKQKMFFSYMSYTVHGYRHSACYMYMYM